jgi:tetratricopeptide (TPR) repeat protein
MAAKIDKKELIEPDKMQLFLERVRMFAERNKKRIYAGAGLFLLIALIAGGWSLYWFNYETTAGNIYAKVFEISTKSSSPKADEEAIKGYEDLTARYPRSRMAIIAYYRLGNLYFSRQEVDKSISAYQAFLNKTEEASDLVTLAYNGLGSCYELKKDLNKALDSYEKAIKTKSGLLFESLSYRNVARVYEAMNNPVKASEYYRKALEKTKDPLMMLFLKRKISLLG